MSIENDGKYKSIPVREAQVLSEKYAKSVIFILGIDTVFTRLHTVTYGVSAQEKEWAAMVGEKLTKFLNPEFQAMESFQDYRTLDQGKMVVYIEQLQRACRAADHAIASVMATREGITEEALQTVRDTIKQALDGNPAEEVHVQSPNMTPSGIHLYVITSINSGRDGAPFALCEKHFDTWTAKDRVIWRQIGQHTSEPCQICT